MSAPVFELLKRPDELHVVEQAHLHPRFVEDSVRLMIAGAFEHYDDLSDGCFLLARQVNHETIHNHDVLAERHGKVAELRADLAAARRRHPAPHHRARLARRPLTDNVNTRCQAPVFTFCGRAADNGGMRSAGLVTLLVAALA